MTEYTLRLAQASESEIITAQRQGMFEAMGSADAAALAQMSELYIPWVRARIEQGLYLGWFACTDAGSIVGGAGLWLVEWPPTVLAPGTTRGYVMNVFVDPAHRGQGLATQMMRAIMAWCHDHGILTITLHASDQGRPIYESLGFDQTNEMRIILDH